MKFLKKFFVSLIYLFTMNIFLSKIGYNVPINIFSLFVSYFFGFPGIIMLLFLSRW